MKGQLSFLHVYICFYTHIIHANDTHLVFWCTIYVFLCFFHSEWQTYYCMSYIYIYIYVHIDPIPNDCKNTKQRIIRIRITYWSTQIIDPTTVMIHRHLLCKGSDLTEPGSRDAIGNNHGKDRRSPKSNIQDISFLLMAEILHQLRLVVYPRI